MMSKSQSQNVYNLQNSPDLDIRCLYNCSILWKLSRHHSQSQSRMLMSIQWKLIKNISNSIMSWTPLNNNNIGTNGITNKMHLHIDMFGFACGHRILGIRNIAFSVFHHWCRMCQDYRELSNYLGNMTSWWVVAHNDMYSASIVDKATLGWSREPNATADPHISNAYPVRDFPSGPSAKEDLCQAIGVKGTLAPRYIYYSGAYPIRLFQPCSLPGNIC